MASTLVETIGFAAAATSTLCWFPQSVRTLRTRDTTGISLISQAAFTGGVLLWASYGVLIGSLPLILCNTIQLVPLTAILWIKVGNQRATRELSP